MMFQNELLPRTDGSMQKLELVCPKARASTEASTDPISQVTSTPRIRSLPSNQPPVSQLQGLGVIVRDFAYMDKLPPVASVGPPPKIQFAKQPTPRDINTSCS